MRILQRYLSLPVEQDLEEKMVFLSGPRQVGKTVLAQEILRRRRGLYLNWDNKSDREIIRYGKWPPERSLIILDELHKFRKWKSHLKGEYDLHRNKHNFLVTGSARLNIYRRGGDSLQGRYHSHRLHPFSLAEMVGAKYAVKRVGQPFEIAPEKKQDKGVIQSLYQFSGFPEPFLRSSPRHHRRWQKERIDRVVSEDVRDLSNVLDLSSLQILSDLLPSRASSLLSLNNLREDLEVSHRAISHWMNLFEQLYYCYRLPPYSARLLNALKKERKLYLWDWSSVEDPGARFENMVAGHLLKFCHYIEDTEGYKIELHYLRDKARREVDFLVTLNKKPWFAVEAKLSEGRDHHLRYFGDRLGIPQLFYVSMDGKTYQQDRIIYISADRFFRTLGV